MKLAYCGINCKLCLFYVNKRCDGCHELKCSIAKCAAEKEIETCSECKEFPCRNFLSNLNICLKELKTKPRKIVMINAATTKFC